MVFQHLGSSIAWDLSGSIGSSSYDDFYEFSFGYSFCVDVIIRYYDAKTIAYLHHFSVCLYDHN